jgi:hypothetical protein
MIERKKTRKYVERARDGTYRYPELESRLTP